MPDCVAKTAVTGVYSELQDSWQQSYQGGVAILLVS